MGRRRDQRKSLVLPVRVFGTDINGKPFSQNCCTLDLNPKGAKVCGVRCLTAKGDVINLQYKTSRAPFEVVWVGEARSARDGQLGIRAIDPRKNFWGFDIDYNPVDDFVLSSQPPGQGETKTSASASW